MSILQNLRPYRRLVDPPALGVTAEKYLRMRSMPCSSFHRSFSCRLICDESVMLIMSRKSTYVFVLDSIRGWKYVNRHWNPRVFVNVCWLVFVRMMRNNSPISQNEVKSNDCLVAIVKPYELDVYRLQLSSLHWCCLQLIEEETVVELNQQRLVKKINH